MKHLQHKQANKGKHTYVLGTHLYQSVEQRVI